jgi:hypothetical protein
MMAKGLVLREVAVLVVRVVAGSDGWAPCWNGEKRGKIGVRVIDSDPNFSIFLLNEAQVQTFATEPAPR